MVQDGTPRGLSRRDIIKKGIVVGGAVAWVPPVVESFIASAAATSAMGAGGISYVALLLSCGIGPLATCTEVKVDPTANPTSECGVPGGLTTPCCTPMTGCAGILGTRATCPPGLAASGSQSGVTVVIPSGCTVVDFRVHCGQCCDGPGAIGQPSTPAVGGITFSQCSGIGNTNFPCSKTGNQFQPCDQTAHPNKTHSDAI